MCVPLQERKLEGRRRIHNRRVNNYSIFPKYKRLVELKCYALEDGNSLQVEPERRECMTDKIQVG